MRGAASQVPSAPAAQLAAGSVCEDSAQCQLLSCVREESPSEPLLSL